MPVDLHFRPKPAVKLARSPLNCAPKWRSYWRDLYSAFPMVDDGRSSPAQVYDIVRGEAHAINTGAFAESNDRPGYVLRGDAGSEYIDLVGTAWATGFAPDNHASVLVLCKRTVAVSGTFRGSPLQCRGAGAAQSHYPFSDGNFYCSILEDGTRHTISSIPSTDMWHCLVVTKESDRTNGYSVYQNHERLLQTTGNTAVGKSAISMFGNSNFMFGGPLALVLWWNRALTPNEVRKLVDDPFGPIRWSYDRRVLHSVKSAAAPAPSGDDFPFRKYYQMAGSL